MGKKKNGKGGIPRLRGRVGKVKKNRGNEMGGEGRRTKDD